MSAHPNDFLFLFPLLPLIGAGAIGLMALLSNRGEHGPSRGLVGTIATAMPAIGFFLALWMVVYWNTTHTDGLVDVHARSLAYEQTLWTWIDTGTWTASLGFRFDQLTAVFLLVICGIGSLIHLYSMGYMATDRGYARYFAYLNLFIFSMIILVLADNLLLTFLGWEGVGLCSYLLIGFWNKDHENNDAARKAFVANRVGDLGLLLGAFMLLIAMGDAATLDYAGMASWAEALSGGELGGNTGLLITVGTLLIFLGCTGKSAQIPLFTWLPDAMAGPTPVSALIHAATMVTAGVFLCARMADVFVLSPFTMNVIFIIALATALYAAVVALYQWDIKKVLAYSTVSQLGFMFMAVGVGAFDVAVFHVITHALFKATLFLGSGAVIHACHHEQDMRRYGGLYKLLPVTSFAMFAGFYAIIGLPGGSGFFSKDLILENIALTGGAHWIGYIIALATALLTAVYMGRMMYLTFWSPARPAHGDQHHLHDIPVSMNIPLIILGVASIIGGVMWVGFFQGTNVLQQWLSPVLSHAQAIVHGKDVEEYRHYITDHTPGWYVWVFALISVAAAIVGVLIARRWKAGPADTTVAPLQGTGATITTIFDKIYEAVIIRPLGVLAGVFQLFVETAIIQSLVDATGDLVRFVGSGYQLIQRSRLRSNLTMGMVGVALVMLVVLWDVLWGAI